MDCVRVCSSGQLDIIIALELSEYLVDETEYVPWRTGLDALRYINGLLEGHPDYLYFKVNTLIYHNKYILSSSLNCAPVTMIGHRCIT